MSVIPLQHEIYYPESDGQPLGETEIHVRQLFDLYAALDHHFRNDPDVYVAANLFLYYKEGDVRSVVCPDVFLVRGVPKGDERGRDIYKLWEEGKPPSVVFEITSPSTRREDFVKKKSCYERLGVEEYFLHDPKEEYLEPPLQGFRLADGRYRAIQPEADGTLLSRTTGLKLQLVGQRLRLVEPATGDFVPGLKELNEMPGQLREAFRKVAAALESAAAAREEAAAARQEAEAVRQAAEERVRALEEELARLRDGRS